MKIRQNTFLVSLLWILLMTASFVWNYAQANREQERLALHSARSLFNQIVFTCRWNGRHGGVYVPVSKAPDGEAAPPLPMDIIKVNPSLSLTKISPALMSKQIAEIAKEKNIRYDIISTHPVNSMNKVTEEEEGVFHKFEAGLDEEGKFITTGENTSFSYIAPLKIKPVCLQCHDKQLHKEGDIMGGIRVILPHTRRPFLDPLLFAHIGITLLGLLGILVAGIRLSRAYAIIQRQAIYDALTGIPNRLNFAEHIVKEFSRSSRTRESLAVIMCDIDLFKAYNDTYGHNSGDKCLQKVAQTIKNSLVRPGDFCARYGGEEFVVILADTSYKGAIHVAERIRFNIIKLQIAHEKSQPLQLVTLSLGIAATSGQPMNSHEELLKNADAALYEAKRNGRNRVESFVDIPSASMG
jgi:diguanylate cyclase (GGDEF)-like protein